MGIRAKLAFPMVLAFVIFAGLLHFIWAKDYVNEARNLRLQNEHRLLATLSPGLVRTLLASDLASLYATLDHNLEINKPYWRDIKLLNGQGRRLYPIDDMKIKPDKYLVTIKHKLIWEGKIIGILILSLDLKVQLASIYRRITQLEIFALLIFGVVSLLAVIWQNKLIRSPLLKLQHAADNLARGDFNVELPHTSRDEVGHLTRAFESMRYQLKLAQENLESRVTQRTHELMQAKEEADRANLSKSEFLSRMSHELRTPLNAVLGFGQILQMDDDNLNEEQRVAIEHILIGGKHLLQLINEVLDIAKVDAGAMELNIEQVQLNKVMDTALLLIRPLAQSQGVVVHAPIIPPDCYVLADSQRLTQVLVNLLSNAVKYNCPGGDVTTHCEILSSDSSDKDKRMVRITITDSGIGMREEDFDKIFEPFQRITLQAKNIEGTGVGLSITKKMIELMQGRIGFTSAYGKGSTFWVELPLGDDGNVINEEPIDAKLKNHVLQGAGTILYVEDKADNVMLIKQLIESRTDWNFLSASTAEQGIEIAKMQQPDIILMDIDLPGMNGFEAQEILRANTQTAHIPVIAVSAQVMERHPDKGQKSAFDDFVSKPIDLDELLEVIGQHA